MINKHFQKFFELLCELRVVLMSPGGGIEFGAESVQFGDEAPDTIPQISKAMYEEFKKAMTSLGTSGNMDKFQNDVSLIETKVKNWAEGAGITTNDFKDVFEAASKLYDGIIQSEIDNLESKLNKLLQNARVIFRDSKEYKAVKSIVNGNPQTTVKNIVHNAYAGIEPGSWSGEQNGRLYMYGDKVYMDIQGGDYSNNEFGPSKNLMAMALLSYNLEAVGVNDAIDDGVSKSHREVQKAVSKQIALQAFLNSDPKGKAIIKAYEDRNYSEYNNLLEKYDNFSISIDLSEFPGMKKYIEENGGKVPSSGKLQITDLSLKKDLGLKEISLVENDTEFVKAKHNVMKKVNEANSKVITAESKPEDGRLVPAYGQEFANKAAELRCYSVLKDVYTKHIYNKYKGVYTDLVNPANISNFREMARALDWSKVSSFSPPFYFENLGASTEYDVTTIKLTVKGCSGSPFKGESDIFSKSRIIAQKLNETYEMSYPKNVYGGNSVSSFDQFNSFFKKSGLFGLTKGQRQQYRSYMSSLGYGDVGDKRLAFVGGVVEKDDKGEEKTVVASRENELNKGEKVMKLSSEALAAKNFMNPARKAMFKQICMGNKPADVFLSEIRGQAEIIKPASAGEAFKKYLFKQIRDQMQNFITTYAQFNNLNSLKIHDGLSGRIGRARQLKQTMALFDNDMSSANVEVKLSYRADTFHPTKGMETGLPAGPYNLETYFCKYYAHQLKLGYDRAVATIKDPKTPAGAGKKLQQALFDSTKQVAAALGEVDYIEQENPRGETGPKVAEVKGIMKSMVVYTTEFLKRPSRGSAAYKEFFDMYKSERGKVMSKVPNLVSSLDKQISDKLSDHVKNMSISKDTHDIHLTELMHFASFLKARDYPRLPNTVNRIVEAKAGDIAEVYFKETYTSLNDFKKLSKDNNIKFSKRPNSKYTNTIGPVILKRMDLAAKAFVDDLDANTLSPSDLGFKRSDFVPIYANLVTSEVGFDSAGNAYENKLVESIYNTHKLGPSDASQLEAKLKKMGTDDLDTQILPVIETYLEVVKNVGAVKLEGELAKIKVTAQNIVKENVKKHTDNVSKLNIAKIKPEDWLSTNGRNIIAQDLLRTEKDASFATGEPKLGDKESKEMKIAYKMKADEQVKAFIQTKYLANNSISELIADLKPEEVQEFRKNLKILDVSLKTNFVSHFETQIQGEFKSYFDNMKTVESIKTLPAQYKTLKDTYFNADQLGVNTGTHFENLLKEKMKESAIVDDAIKEENAFSEYRSVLEANQFSVITPKVDFLQVFKDTFIGSKDSVVKNGKLQSLKVIYSAGAVTPRESNLKAIAALLNEAVPKGYACTESVDEIVKKIKNTHSNKNIEGSQFYLLDEGGQHNIVNFKKTIKNNIKVKDSKITFSIDEIPGSSYEMRLPVPLLDKPKFEKTLERMAKFKEVALKVQPIEAQFGGGLMKSLDLVMNKLGADQGSTMEFQVGKAVETKVKANIEAKMGVGKFTCEMDSTSNDIVIAKKGSSTKIQIKHGSFAVQVMEGNTEVKNYAKKLTNFNQVIKFLEAGSIRDYEHQGNLEKSKAEYNVIVGELTIDNASDVSTIQKKFHNLVVYCSKIPKNVQPQRNDMINRAVSAMNETMRKPIIAKLANNYANLDPKSENGGKQLYNMMMALEAISDGSGDGAGTKDLLVKRITREYFDDTQGVITENLVESAKNNFGEAMGIIEQFDKPAEVQKAMKRVFLRKFVREMEQDRNNEYKNVYKSGNSIYLINKAAYKSQIDEGNNNAARGSMYTSMMKRFDIDVKTYPNYIVDIDANTGNITVKSPAIAPPRAQQDEPLTFRTNDVSMKYDLIQAAFVKVAEKVEADIARVKGLETKKKGAEQEEINNKNEALNLAKELINSGSLYYNIEFTKAVSEVSGKADVKVMRLPIFNNENYQKYLASGKTGNAEFNNVILATLSTDVGTSGDSSAVRKEIKDHIVLMIQDIQTQKFNPQKPMRVRGNMVYIYSAKPNGKPYVNIVNVEEYTDDKMTIRVQGHSPKYITVGYGPDAKTYEWDDGANGAVLKTGKPGGETLPVLLERLKKQEDEKMKAAATKKKAK